MTVGMRAVEADIERREGRRFEITIQADIMRAIVFILAASLLAGCASAPVNSALTTYDRKYNMIAQPKAGETEFVGTSAAVTPAKKQPSWYRFGHP